ncbi:MAG: NUDIX domain-containing protein [Nocardioidaceae bacterium]|nr:NUDIX domain-containing protein [Nocardioidaceae bacterium]
MSAERVVVAAVIVEHGRVLAARRRQPFCTAGGWELPGGKVDPGESPAEALRREVHEELGCAIEVGERFAGAQTLPSGLVLHAYECHLASAPAGDPVSSEPRPGEHDAIRWLAPEELDEVAWLPADRPFVEGVRQRLLDGEPLPGGNVGGSVRIGSTVRRPTGAWTPAVHALLAHVRARGLDGVPRVLGFDSRGREVLTFIEGRAFDPDERVPDVQVRDIGSWLARFHAAVTGFVPPGEAPWRNTVRALGAGEIICHLDVAPYNVVVHEGRLAAVIDWDMAGPGHPVDDLSFSAWNAVPLYRDVGADESARRLRLLCDAYGDVDPVVVLRGVVPRIEDATARIAAGQRLGDQGMLNLRAIGEPQRSVGRLARLTARLPDIEDRLRRRGAR